MGTLDFSVFGAAGTTIAFMAIAIRALWADRKEREARLDKIQSDTLPVVTEATKIMADFGRTAAVLLDRYRPD